MRKLFFILTVAAALILTACGGEGGGGSGGGGSFVTKSGEVWANDNIANSGYCFTDGISRTGKFKNNEWLMVKMGSYSGNTVTVDVAVSCTATVSGNKLKLVEKYAGTTYVTATKKTGQKIRFAD